MADRSENPGDVARMARLEGSLDGLIGELEAQRRQGEALTREVKADAARAKADRTAAAKEARVRKTQATAPVAAGAETPVAVRDFTHELENQRIAEERLAAASRQRGLATERANQRTQRSGLFLPSSSNDLLRLEES